MAGNDNVATMLCDAKAGEEVSVYDENHHQVRTMEAKDNIPYGNKIALYDIKKDEKIIKYGEKAGIVYRDITAGTLVHVHNVRSLFLDIPETIIEEIIQEMHISQEEKK